MHSVIFFGTDEFAVSILSIMLDSNINVSAVVTKPDRAIKRNKKQIPCPVKQYVLTEKLSLNLLQPEKASTSEFAATLKGYNPDLFVVVSYGEIISQQLLDIPKLMAINIHPSFLPKYRGASPLRSALLNGDKEVGIAIIEMVKAMDAGDILKMSQLVVKKNENHSALEKRVFVEAGLLLLECLKDFASNAVKKTPQIGNPSYTKKFGREDLEIKWIEGVDLVLNKIRAFGEKPGAFCHILVGGKKKVIKLLEAEKISTTRNSSIKTLEFSKTNGWTVALNDGVIRILKVHLENKKPANITDFINGMRQDAPVLVLS